MAIKVGDRVPSVTFRKLTDEGMEEVSTDELFKGRRVVVFGVPGAFTPTCSAQHLPGFIHNAEAIKAKGIDEIACVSVNDAFVMRAWGGAQGADGKVTMLADGNGDFTRAVGVEIDASGFGMGKRSARYSLLVEDGVVKQINVEEAPGQMKVSSAESLLAQG